MPNQDGTGPTGAGQMTGRGLGPCGGCVRVGPCGRRQGLGLGLRRANLSPENKLQALEEEHRILTDSVKEVEAEINTLKDQK